MIQAVRFHQGGSEDEMFISAKSIVLRLIPVALILMLNLTTVVIGTDRPSQNPVAPAITVRADSSAEPDENLAPERVVPVHILNMEQSLPDPTGRPTTISYAVGEGLRPVRVTIEVFDAGGRHVRSLVDDYHQPGQYSFFWQGTDEEGNKLAGGDYFYMLQAGSYVATRKLVIGG